MNATQWKNALAAGQYDAALLPLYGTENLASRKERIAAAIDSFVGLFGNRPNLRVFSVPGRSEICGNHTDHNHGRCLAASVDCDILAVAATTDSDLIHLRSEGFPGDTVRLHDLAPTSYPRFKSVALCAGSCAAFRDHGHRLGGFDAYTTSNVLKGSGLSSSAAFEVMVGNLLNHLYNDGKIPPTELAKYAQWAENNYFGKPCGLLDQTACAVGGMVALDFADPAEPTVKKLSFDLDSEGYDLCITNTGGSHSDLNDEYAAIPGEMKQVAALYGKDVLLGLTEETLLRDAAKIRTQCGDRALLRALHFVNENDRVDAACHAIRGKNMPGFLSVINASGLSSARYLQNVFAAKNPAEQSISLALYLSEKLLADCKRPAAFRVHGGGFAGTIQAFVPKEDTPRYREGMDAVLGEGSCMVMRVRPYGAVEITAAKA